MLSAIQNISGHVLLLLDIIALPSPEAKCHILDTMVAVTPAAAEAATATTITGAGPGGVATAAPVGRGSAPGRWGDTRPPRGTRSENKNIQ